MEPISIYAEMTPNPAVLKFVANKRLIEQDSVEFKNIEEAQPSPLAVKLFHLPFVNEIFISGNYLAITKYEIVEWEDVTMEVRELIREYLADGGEVLKQLVSAEAQQSGPTKEEIGQAMGKKVEEYSPMDHKIVDLLNEYVLPAVSSDGGNIKFLEEKNGVVSVLLQGACSGCPSSTQTLKQGIETMLQQMLPGQIKRVEAING